MNPIKLDPIPRDGFHVWEPHHFTMRGHTVQGFSCLRCGCGMYADWLQRKHLASGGCQLPSSASKPTVTIGTIPEDARYWLVLTDRRIPLPST